MDRHTCRGSRRRWFRVGSGGSGRGEDVAPHPTCPAGGWGPEMGRRGPRGSDRREYIVALSLPCISHHRARRRHAVTPAGTPAPGRLRVIASIQPSVVLSGQDGTMDAELGTDRGDVLRPWDRCDWPAVVGAFADPLMSSQLSEPLDDVEAARDWVTDHVERWESGEAFSWAVVHDETLLGSVTVSSIDRRHDVPRRHLATMPRRRSRW